MSITPHFYHYSPLWPLLTFFQNPIAPINLTIHQAKPSQNPFSLPLPPQLCTSLPHFTIPSIQTCSSSHMRGNLILLYLYTIMSIIMHQLSPLMHIHQTPLFISYPRTKRLLHMATLIPILQHAQWLYPSYPFSTSPYPFSTSPYSFHIVIHFS